MARNNSRFGLPRLSATADSAAPAAPSNVDGSTVQPVVAGVVDVDGAVALVIDVFPVSTGHCTVQAMYWNETARKWVFDTSKGAVATSAGVATRVNVGNGFIGSRFAYVYVTSITGTVDVYLGAVMQQGGA